MHHMLDKLASAVTAYLNAQIAAGAQAVMIFDTWGGDADPDRLPKLLACLHAAHRRRPDARERGTRVPVILFTKGGGQWLEEMADTGCDALGVDWTTDLADARAQVGDRVALQGNLDPCVLYASPERIRGGSAMCWPASATVRATSSTSATAFTRTSIRERPG